MKDGTIAIIVDTDNAATVDFRAELAQIMIDGGQVSIGNNEMQIGQDGGAIERNGLFKILEMIREPITEDNRGRQDVFILEQIEKKTKSRYIPCACGKDGLPREHHGVKAGIHCDECWESLLDDYGKQSW